MTLIEIWKDCVEYDGMYQVSNLGRVKTFRFNNCEVGRMFSVNPGTVWEIINGKTWRGVY